MASFRFNFGGDDGEEAGNSMKDGDMSSTSVPGAGFLEAKELFSSAVEQRPPSESEAVLVAPDLQFVKMKTDQIETGTGVSDIIKTSDIQTGLYEGGFKLWECAVDLVQYLHKGSTSLGQNTSVIELGCGHGIPGLYTLMKGCNVVFSDYNEEVITHGTIPNIQANAPNLMPAARFFSGDWLSLCQKLEGQRFSLLLSSDTIYTPEVTTRLVASIKQLLHHNGVALIAAKRYYFGTGGSCEQFRQEITASGDMVVEVVALLEDRKSNIREIMKVTYKQQNQ